MADDKDAKPSIPSISDHKASDQTAASEQPKDPRNEWTVSDRRGPLSSAENDDLEPVSAPETGAEGGLDPAAAATTGAPDDAGHSEPKPPAAEVPAGAAAAHASSASSSAADGAPKRSLAPVAAALVVGAVIGAGSAWLVYSQAGSGAAADHQQLASLSARVDALDKRPNAGAELSSVQSSLADLQGKVASLEKALPAKGGSAAAPQQASQPAAPDQQAGSDQQSGHGEQAQTPPGKGQAGGTEAAAQNQPPAAANGADAALAGKVAGLQAALDELRTRTAALQAQDTKESGAADKVADLQNGVADARKQAAGTQADLDGVKTALKGIGEKLAALSTAVAGAQKQASGAQSGVETVQSQQKALEGRLGSPATAVAADSLVQQIDAGRPYSQQVDALAALKADPARIAVLRENAERGVSSAQALLARWKPLENVVIATANAAPAGANFGQRLEHGLFGLVSVRRADTTSGNGLAARVNTIAADLAGDDVAGAYAAWQALPAEAKTRSESWGALAKSSAEAIAAARDLQHAAISALGPK